MTRGSERYVEIGLPEGTIMIGFAPAAPDGKPSPIVTIRSDSESLLGTVTPQDAITQAFEILARENGKDVPARLVRGLACFVIAHVRLRLNHLQDIGGQPPADRAASCIADAAAPAAADAMPSPPASRCEPCGG